MKDRRGPIALIVLGSLLVLGPLWGLLGTIVGMIRSFETVAQQAGAAKAEQLASGISLSLWSTAAGLAIEPIGLAVLIAGIVWLVRMNRNERAANQASEAISAPGAPQLQR